MAYSIREEQPGDIPGIHAVEQAAFERIAEADLVDALRTNGRAVLSLVAADQSSGEIVGHALFTPVTIRLEHGSVGALGLGPIAVKPALQRQGIGSSLIRAGVEMLRRGGHEILVVEGSSVYYPRFGFQDASKYGLTCQFNPPPGCFMVMELKPGALTPMPGMVYYAPEFEAVG